MTSLYMGCYWPAGIGLQKRGNSEMRRGGYRERMRRDTPPASVKCSMPTDFRIFRTFMCKIYKQNWLPGICQCVQLSGLRPLPPPEAFTRGFAPRPRWGLHPLPPMPPADSFWTRLWRKAVHCGWATLAIALNCAAKYREELQTLVTQCDTVCGAWNKAPDPTAFCSRWLHASALTVDCRTSLCFHGHPNWSYWTRTRHVGDVPTPYVLRPLPLCRVFEWMSEQWRSQGGQKGCSPLFLQHAENLFFSVVLTSEKNGTFYEWKSVRSSADRVTYKLGVIMHRCRHGKAPQYLVHCCTRVTDVVGRQRLRSATQQVMVVSRHRLSTVGRRAFTV